MSEFFALQGSNRTRDVLVQALLLVKLYVSICKSSGKAALLLIT